MFGSPDMLWWGAAAGIPIIIHLLSRRRFIKVPWAAMDFLNRAFKKTRRRLRIENLLLLLLRILVLLLLASSLADPRLASSALFGDSGSGTRNVLLIMDTSFSMDVRDASDTSAFARAKSTALQILGRLDGERDTAGLVTSGTPARLVRKFGGELDRVQLAVNALEVTHAATDTVGAFKVAAGLLQDPALERDFPGPKTIYYLTDLQKAPLLAPPQTVEDESGGVREVQSDSPDASVEAVLREIADTGARMVLVDVGRGSDDAGANVAVTALDHVGKALVKGVPTEFECRIENFGATTVGGEVRFYLDNDEQWIQQEQVLNLKGTDTGTASEVEQSFTFTCEFKTAGWHWVGVKYFDDALKVDNSRRIALYVRESIRVLTVNGTKSRDEWDSATFFITRALDPFLGRGREGTTSFKVRDVDVINFAHEDLEDHDIVVLANVAQLPAGKIRELEEFVKGGGSLLFFPGANFETPGSLGATGGSVNAQFFRGGEGLLPARLLRAVGADVFTETPYFMQFSEFDHPAVAYFADPKIRPALTRLPVSKLIEVEVPKDDERVSVLNWFRKKSDTGAEDKLYPAILEKNIGRGHVMLVTTTADTTWNYYGTTPAFVPLIKEICYWVARVAGRTNFVVGETHQEEFPPTVQRVLVEQGGSPAEERATSLSPDKTAAVVDLDRLERAEVIRIKVAPGQLGGDSTPRDRERLVATNVDPAESDLTRADRNYLTAHFGTDLLEVVTDIEDVVEKADAADDSRLWRALLWAVLACLVLETLLAHRFSHASRSGGDAAA